MKIFTHHDYTTIIRDFCKQKISDKVNKKDFTSHYEFIISHIFLNHYIDRRYKQGDFVNINSIIAKKLISKQEFKTIMKDLVQLNIIESDCTYIVGEKSLGYRLLEVKEGWKLLEISDSKLSCKLDRLFKEYELNCLNKGDGYKVVYYWSKELSINETLANEFIDNKIHKECKEFIKLFIKNNKNEFYYNEIMSIINDNIKNIDNIKYDEVKLCIAGIRLFINSNRFNESNVSRKSAMKFFIECLDLNTSCAMSIELLMNQKFFSVDNTVNRCHTNISNISSNLRQFLNINNEKLSQVDITNSQPLFLGVLMCKRENIDKVELSNYLKECQDGNFYEYLAAKGGFEGDITSNKEIRKYFKQNIFSGCLFNRNMYVLSKWEKIFKNAFPTIFNEIKTIKKDYHEALAIMLQREESEFIYKTVSKINKVFRYNAPLLTIHDSIVSNSQNIHKVKEIMQKEFLNKYNLIPKLEITNF